MNVLARAWCFAELCSHDRQDSGDGDTDVHDYIRDYVSVTIPDGLFTQMKNAIEYMYVLETGDEIYFVFRGTDGAEGWKTDFTVLPPYPRGYMHRGFDSLMQVFIPAIRDILRNIDGIERKTVKTVGHSLGGICAQYCSFYLWELFGIKSTSVNFGAPCGGIRGWAEKINSYPINNYRVVNGWDLVTEFLDDTVGSHGGVLVRLPQPFWHRFPVVQLLDHRYSAYTKALIEYSRRMGDKEGVTALQEVLKRCNI